MSEPSSFKTVFKGLALLAVLGGLVGLGRVLGLESTLLSRQWILSHVEGQGAAGVFFFVGLTALSTGLGMPRQVLAFMGGYVFGWFWGTLLSTLGTVLGCALGFALARTLARGAVTARLGRRVARLDAFLLSAPFKSTLAIRLFPVGHNLTTNLAAGVTSIPAWAFLLGSGAGYLPQQLGSALFGAGVNAESDTGRLLTLGLSVLLLGASAWLGMSVYRAYRRKGAVPVEDEGGEE